MADPSNKELNTDDEIIDVSFLWRDRASLSDTASNDEAEGIPGNDNVSTRSDTASDDDAEKIPGNDNVSTRVSEVLPAPVLAAVQDSETNAHDQNITSLSLPSTSAQATWNEREAKTRLFLSFCEGLDESIGDRNFRGVAIPDPVTESNPRFLRISSRVPTEGRNSVSPLSVSELAGPTTDQDEINSVTTDSNDSSTFSEDQSLLEELSIAQLPDRNPRRVTEIMSHSGRTRGRNIFTPTRLPPRTTRNETPGISSSLLFAERSVNDMAGDGIVRELFPREVFPQLLPLRVRELRNTRPLVRGRYNVSPPRYYSRVNSLSNTRNIVLEHGHSSLYSDEGSSAMREPRRVQELISSSSDANSPPGQNINSPERLGYNTRLLLPFSETASSLIDDETSPSLLPREPDSQSPRFDMDLSNTSPLSSSRYAISTRPYPQVNWEIMMTNGSCAFHRQPVPNTSAQIAIWDEVLENRRSSLSFDEEIISPMRNSSAEWNESFTSRDADRWLSSSVEIRERSFMIASPSVSEDDDDSYDDDSSDDDANSARGAMFAKEKKERISPGKPGDSKKKDPKPKRRGQ